MFLYESDDIYVKFSKAKLTLTRVNCSSAHPEPVYEGTLTGPSRLRRRSGAFSVRIVKLWNRFPAHQVLLPLVSMNKKQFDRQLSKIFPTAPA